MDTSTDETVDVTPPPQWQRVAIDTTPYDTWSSGAFVRKITDAGDLMTGAAAQGRIGDWLIGNGTARFIVQQKDRHIGPCPYGGTIIDVGRVSNAGAPVRDVTGEICLFIQVGRTLLSHTFEVINDGSDGPAILAVTGEDTTLDFINLRSLLAEYLGPQAELPVDTEADLPVTITQYFILAGDSNALRVVTAIRYDSADGEGETLSLGLGDLIDSGGTVEFFNPSSSKKGFGYKSVNPEPMSFMAFTGANGSYAYVPDPQADGRDGAAYLAVAGVVGLVLGTDDAFGLLLTPKEILPDHPAVMTLNPGETGSSGRWIVAGTGNIASLTDEIFRLRKKETGQLRVTVVDTQDTPAAGHRVSLGSQGQAISQGITDANGQFTLDLPAGTFDVMADPTLRRVISTPSVTVETGTLTETTVQVEMQGRIEVSITDPNGQPVPAKISVRCVGECAPKANSTHRDTSFDSPPGDTKAVAFAPVNGKATVLVPSGDYRVVVSRGPLWSVWPNNNLTGQPISVVPGGKVTLNPVISQAVPTAGWVSGDLHVHSVNSPDSPISTKRRVLSMLAEGVGVIVSTDHDYITDYQPVIVALGASTLITSVMGEELTTFDYGHFNAFPLNHAGGEINGGAKDWAGGEGPSLHPKDIFALLQADPGEQVVQVNHGARGYFRYIEWDANTDLTFADPSNFRIDSGPPDPVTGDTGLWSADFTAIEMLNGIKSSGFYEHAGWWYTLLSRGIRRTGTAVSDTHKAISNASGGSRTYVYVGTGFDTPATFDAQRFAQRINAGQVVGSNGPFVELSVDGESQTQSIGSTISLGSPGQEITIVARIRTPLWMGFDRVEVIGNVTGVAPPPGVPVPAKPGPLTTVDVELTDDDIVDSQYYERLVPLTVTVDTDSWFIVLVHGSEEGTASMYPVLPYSGPRPFAFTNPIWVDVGNDGWTPLQPPATPPSAQQKPMPHTPSARRPVSRGDLETIIEGVRSSHCRGDLTRTNH